MLVGIDEVGRGCWAGPVVAGAVMLGPHIEGLCDSKTLLKQRRALLAAEIHACAQAVGLGWVDASTVDRIGLTEAVRLAMRRALAEIKMPYAEVIVDGNYNFLSDIPGSAALIKADATIPAVSAASIVAKVARDEYMSGLGTEYSKYAFERHVGYGTALHLERLQEHGISDQHRRSVKPVAALIQLT